MNNYIVTFEYRVMVTAFAILAMFLQCSPSLPQPSVGQSVDCHTPAPVVESVTHENVKLSGHWPQQQWSSVYWQSWAPVVGVAQSSPMEGGSKGHSDQIGDEIIKEDQSYKMTKCTMR